MNTTSVLALCLITASSFAQSGEKAIPSVSTLTLGDGEVATIHLCAGYTTSLRLPEEVTSIVVGDPARFKAEHSASEPRLVFLKPLTSQRGQSNALITTKSGDEINLNLVNGCGGTKNASVDFFVEYRLPQSSVVGSSDAPSFMVHQSASLSSAQAINAAPNLADEVLSLQSQIATPAWEGSDLKLAIGQSVGSNDELIVGFSVLNNSGKPIELLTPQIQLSGKGRKKNQIKADPVAISEYRYTAQRLAAGQRADGVVVFERPGFKEESERLLLAVATADAVNRPVVLPLPFTARIQGGSTQ